jgi:hypothetical protein
MAVIATLAVSGLSACRQAPDVAVYFGNTVQVPLAEVERIYSDAADRLAAARTAALEQQQQPAESAPPLQVPITTADVVGVLVSREIGNRLARQKNIAQPAAQDPAPVAQALGLPPDAEFTKLYAENYALYNALLQGAKPVQPTDADLRSVYDALKKAGSVAPDVTFDAFRSGISPQNQQLLSAGFAVRDDVETQLDEVDATVNPRFGAADVDVVVAQGENQQLFGLISVPIADQDVSPVTDLG